MQDIKSSYGRKGIRVSDLRCEGGRGPDGLADRPARFSVFSNQGYLEGEFCSECAEQRPEYARLKNR